MALNDAKDAVKSTFRALDYDHDSCLSMSEFRQLLDRNNIHLNDTGSLFVCRVSRVDYAYFFNMNQKDGKINYSNLRSMIGQFVSNDPYTGRVRAKNSPSLVERAKLFRFIERVHRRACPRRPHDASSERAQGDVQPVHEPLQSQQTAEHISHRRVLHRRPRLQQHGVSDGPLLSHRAPKTPRWRRRPSRATC